MIKKISKYVKFPTMILLVFALYWFLNSGFLTNPKWLLIQAGIFTAITFLIFKYPKIKLMYWFLTIAILYVSSAVFEILQLREMFIMTSSTSFGILVIIMIFQVFRRSEKQ